jgi:TPR repeat protein
MINQILALCLFCLALTACGATAFKQSSEIAEGKRYFDQGYYTKAISMLKSSAEQGNPEAQYALGYMNYYGLGAKQNTSAAYHWLQQAAKQNYLPATKALGMMKKPA